MDKEDIGSRLRSLAKNDQRPKMARMRDIFDDIENALKAKVPHLVLVEELKNSGLDVSLKVFRTMLLRIRKERELENSRNPSNPSVNQPSPSALVSENAQPKGESGPKKPPPAKPAPASISALGLKPTATESDLEVLNKHGCDLSSVDDIFSSMVNKGK